jgi:hypothetical protein
MCHGSFGDNNLSHVIKVELIQQHRTLGGIPWKVKSAYTAQGREVVQETAFRELDDFSWDSLA